ncbi:MAG: hypothetical protein M3451_11495 [Chloroflexota bacterium]|nr:hypothetical protein [Chloroflexota bacterium]
MLNDQLNAVLSPVDRSDHHVLAAEDGLVSRYDPVKTLGLDFRISATG